LEPVAPAAQLLLEAGDLDVGERLLPVERRRAVVGEQLPRVPLVDRLRELLRLTEVGRRRLEPEDVRVRRVREPARDCRIEAVLHAVETLARALTGDER